MSAHGSVSLGSVVAPLWRRFATARGVLLAGTMVLGAMLWLPFHLWHKAPPVPSFYGEAAAFALGLLALATLLPFAGRVAFPRVAWLPLGFVGLLVVQIVLGKLAYYQQGLLAALYLLWVTGLVLLAALLRRELGLERVATLLAWFLFAGALASALIGLAQHLESYAFLGRFMVVSSKGRVWGNLAQPNHLANYLSLGLVSLGYLYATGRLRPLYAVSVGLFATYILSLTGSRAPGLYLVTLVVLSAVFLARERTPLNRRLLAFSTLSLLALYVLPVLLAVPGAITWLQRLDFSGFGSDERLRLWRVAWMLFQDAPLLGQGFRQYGYHYFLANADLPAPRVTGLNDHAHNLVLNVMAEFGLAGLVLLLACAGPWLVGLARQRQTPGLWWLCGLGAVLAIHSGLEYPLWYAYFLGPAALILGLGEAHTLELRADNAARLRSRRLMLTATLLLGWFALGQVWRDYILLESFGAFRYKYVHATPEVERQAAEMVLEIHRTSLLSPWVEVGLARTIHISADGLRDKLSLNARAMRAYPVDDVTYHHAMLLALAGDDAGARRQWDRAAAAFPAERESVTLVLQRRVEDGLEALRPLLGHAQAGQ